jgi:hypothetical protein
MTRLVQIIYISRSSFKPRVQSGGIEPNVGRILAKSRINNRKNGLVGVLYFGDGCFFQCLEGEEQAVDALYAKLQLDPRHKDLRLLSRKRIPALSFTDWAMKFVPLEAQMARLLQVNGYRKFDPYRFSAEMTQQVMALLFTAQDPTGGADLPMPPAPDPLAEAARDRAHWALALSGASLLISLLALGLVLGR